MEPVCKFHRKNSKCQDHYTTQVSAKASQPVELFHAPSFTGEHGDALFGEGHGSMTQPHLVGIGGHKLRSPIRALPRIVWDFSKMTFSPSFVVSFVASFVASFVDSNRNPNLRLPDLGRASRGFPGNGLGTF